MARANDFPRVLWLVTSTWLVGCGRVGFGDVDRGPSDPLPDAPLPIDARTPIDVAPIDSVVIDGPATPGPVGPKLVLAAVPPMTTTCGQQPTSVNVDLGNEGDVDLVISALPSSAGGFKIALTTGPIALPLKVPPAAKVTLVITPPLAVIGSDQGGALKSATLTIESNGAGLSVDTKLDATVMGANIVVTAPTPPGSLLFSGSSGACPVQQPASIRNTGNLGVVVNVGVSSDFAMAGASTATVGAGLTLTRNFRPFTNGTCGASGVIQYTVTGGTYCGASAGVAAAVNASFNITGASTCFCS